MIYDEGWQAKKINHLQRRIAKKLKEIDIKIVQQMFSGIRKQLKLLTIDHMKVVLLNISNTYTCFFICYNLKLHV